MAQPTQLTPTEQDALVKQIGLAMLRVAPDNWEQLTVDYRAVGRYSEATGQVTFSDGRAEPWTMPPDLQGLFARLRGGMYREGRGTWFNARYRLDHPSSYNLEYDREEPAWEVPPPPQAYPDDMRLFPRTEDNVPGWLRRRLAAGPPPPRFRVARIFDGPPGEDGRPLVNRPPVDHDDVGDLLKYLDNAPVVGPGRGFDVDRFGQEARPVVPVAFHTDGTWIWPAAVNYYLREHDVPPEPELVEHVMRSHFQLPVVDEATRSAAAAFLGPGAGPVTGAPGAPPRMPPPGPLGPSGPAGPAGPPPGPTRALAIPQPPGPAAPPPAALPSHGPPGRTVEALRSRLDQLGIPPTAYRIGPPAGRAWTMDQTEGGWRVGWYDREFVAPAMFEDVADASAFLLGKLLLDADRWQAGPGPGAAGLPVPPAPVSPPAENPVDFALASDPGFTAPPQPRRPEPAGRPDSPNPALVETGAGQPVEAQATYTPPGTDRVEPIPTYDLSRPLRARPDSPFEPSRPDSPFEPANSSFAPRSDRAGSTFEPRRPEPGFEPTQPDAGFEPPSPRSGIDERRPESGFEPTRREPSIGEPARSESTSEPRRAEAGLEPAESARSESPLEPRRPESRFELSRSESMFEPPRSEAGFEPPRSENGFEPPRPAESIFEPTRFDAAVEPRADSVFEPGRHDAGFAARSDNSLDATHAEPAPARRPDTRPDSPAARPAASAGQASAQEWPISPLPGEPPLTLFRGKRLTELEPGTEFDRFGDEDGNLVYALGTPFHERSLVPEWVERPYHAYRVREPVRVLTGAAIPWFDQPGGGTAYVLPEAVADLVATGRVVELHGRERPPA